MYIINITYKVPLETIDQYLESHIAYLNEQYEAGHFLASGRKVPRTGGIILSNGSDKLEVAAMIEKDPFKIHGLADYEIIEFVPSKTSEAMAFLLDQA
jgi:uncharacterized protein YciI